MAYHVTNARGSSSLPQRAEGPDYTVIFDGSSLWLFRPMNQGADEHLQENVSAEAQWWAGALVVEHRYAGGLIERLTEAGYRVRVE
jgi:hypothetical protein